LSRVNHLIVDIVCHVFLFKNLPKYGGDHFVGDGFNDWKNPQKIVIACY